MAAGKYTFTVITLKGDQIAWLYIQLLRQRPTIGRLMAFIRVGTFAMQLC